MYDPDSRAEAHEPSEELTAYIYFLLDLESVVPYRDDDVVRPKAVEDRSDQCVVAFQRDVLRLSAEHTEGLPGVPRHVEILEHAFSLARLFSHGDVLHLVHSVMLGLLVLCVVADEIVVLIIPGEDPRTDDVPFAALSRDQLLLQVPLVVGELDLPALADGFVDVVHIVEYLLIEALGAPCHQHASVELSGLRIARQFLQFADQFP